MFDVYANMLVSGVLIGVIYALLALGLTIMFGVMRIVNFAHGEMVMIGMYLGWLLWQAFALPPLLSAPVAMCLMFGLGYGLQYMLVARFVARPQYAQFILFIGLALLITGGLLTGFGPDPLSIDSPASFETVELGRLALDKMRLQGALAALLIIALLFVFLRRSRMGAAIRAAADNPLGAQVIGLKVAQVYAVTAGLGMACAGAAGALVAPVFDMYPWLAMEFTMIAFVIVIVGGLGSLAGALLGGLIIGVSESLAALVLDPAMKSVVSYVLLVGVLLVRPQGLFGNGRAG